MLASLRRVTLPDAPFLRAAAQLSREPQAADRIPYSAHVTDSVIRTRQGHYVFVLRLDGASFETSDDVQVNQWHEQLNGLLRNIASPQLALWTHIVRRRDASRPGGTAPEGFARQLDERYAKRLAAQALMTNDLYVSVVHRPQPRAPGAWAQRLLTRHDTALGAQAQLDALDACEKLQQHLLASLARYQPRLLGLEHSGPVPRSEPLEFFGLLVNGEPQPMPLPRAPIAEVLATSRPSFGSEALEYRTPTLTRVGAMLGIKEYPTPSVPDMYHRLLTAPLPFVLTQSFTFLAKPTAQALLQTQYNRMMNAGDLARSQADALNEALDALAGNEFVLGDHHFTLQVMVDAWPGLAEHDAAPRLAQLNDHVATAREMLADTSMVVAREDLALEAAFWAQLPGNFAYRPRKAPITSRNFAAMSPFDNFPRGRPTGNHWGEALALLTTRAHSPYFFSLHAPLPPDPSAADVEPCPGDVGHTFVCGPTGSGKTVFLGFCMAMLGKLGASQVVFDKDRGLEILVRALGGTYAPLVSGAPTGFNPLRLEPTPANLMFLREWLAQLALQPGAPLTVRQQQDLEQALRGVLVLEPAARRLSRLVEHLDATDPDGLYPRLARWCVATGGEYAWAFDNPEDEVLAQMQSASLAGFDVTEFLEHPVIRTPITMYLFHLVRLLLDGRRFVCWCDEFWRLLDDPAFEAFSRDGPKTWRKLNGVFAASTQSAADVLASPISRTLIEQTATKVFFPNPEARPEDYIDGFGLTEREFGLIRNELSTGSHQFLVKQGHASTVCALDLAGMAPELAVISGRLSSVERMHRLIGALGPQPRQWLAEFIAAETGEIASPPPPLHRESS
jgi:type IV secretion system protein VirB4